MVIRNKNFAVSKILVLSVGDGEKERGVGSGDEERESLESGDGGKERGVGSGDGEIDQSGDWDGRTYQNVGPAEASKLTVSRL